MAKTIARTLYRACSRCHGDLILDEYERGADGSYFYECLQCGRTTQIDVRAETPVERQLPIAA